jgi:hypothetical protein
MEIVRGNTLTRSDRFARGLIAAGILAALLTIFVVPPENLSLTTCAFHSLTGYSCLTCGLTRSLHAVSHGELITSLRHHVMGPVIFIGALLLFFVPAMEAIAGKRKWLPLRGRNAKIIALHIAVFWLFYWGVRIMSELAAKTG